MGQGLTIKGWKETTLINGTITVQVCFIVANVQSPLLGLHDIDDNKVTVHTGDKPYIEKFGNNEQLHRIGAHLHVASMVLPGFHTPNEKSTQGTAQHLQQHSLWVTLRSSANKPTHHDNCDNHHNQQSKNKKRTELPPYITKVGARYVSEHKDNQHTTEKVHSKNNQFCNWTMPQQSTRQEGAHNLDGLCLAIRTVRKGPTRYRLKKFVMENGFGQTIIQVDNEPATQQLAQEAAVLQLKFRACNSVATSLPH
eukprot:6202876-Amphidinium_carterae.2